MLARSKTYLLKEYVRILLDESKQEQKKLRVFDFDDTLVTTDAKVYVTHADNSRSVLTPGEYAVYVTRSGDTFDYSEFQMLINPRQIKWTGRIVNNIYRAHGPGGFIILTARGSSAPVEEFLVDAGLPGVEVVGLGSSDPQAKASWIRERFMSEKLDELEFFDDSIKNIKAVADLNQLPGITTKVRSSNVTGHAIYVCRIVRT